MNFDKEQSMMQAGWKQYLIQQAKLHPSMEPRDVYKMIFQAVFGAEHLLQNQDAAHAYFQEEYEEVNLKEGLLYEQIGENIYRVNLWAWKKQNLPSEWLFRMFVGSVERQTRQGLAAGKKEKQRKFLQFEEIAAEAAKEGAFRFSWEDFQQYRREYQQEGPRAVHHSEQYRRAEKPAYRLVSGDYLRVLPILFRLAEKISAPVSEITSPGKAMVVRPIIVAIDGRCASGKSTMAGMLSEITGVGVVHMDDFFLPMELRTKARLAQPGGNVHYERFQEEVLPFLKMREGFSYRRFDCSKMQLGEERQVAGTPIRIVEGAYSCHPLFDDYADVKVFSDVESEEQLKRIGVRDGEEMLAMFKERWIPMEENYFTACHIRESADIIL